MALVGVVVDSGNRCHRSVISGQVATQSARIVRRIVALSANCVSESCWTAPNPANPMEYELNVLARFSSGVNHETKDC